MGIGTLIAADLAFDAGESSGGARASMEAEDAEIAALAGVLAKNPRFRAGIKKSHDQIVAMSDTIETDTAKADIATVQAKRGRYLMSFFKVAATPDQAAKAKEIAHGALGANLHDVADVFMPKEDSDYLWIAKDIVRNLQMDDGVNRPVPVTGGQGLAFVAQLKDQDYEDVGYQGYGRILAQSYRQMSTGRASVIWNMGHRAEEKVFNRIFDTFAHSTLPRTPDSLSQKFAASAFFQYARNVSDRLYTGHKLNVPQHVTF
jgi:hypothetical protein